MTSSDTIPAPHRTLPVAEAISGLVTGQVRSAADSGMAKLKVLHRETVAALPTQGGAEIRVLEARLAPGDRTPYHSHRHPVTVVMTQGAFTLELDDRAPITLRTGDVFVEPAGIAMIGWNRDPAEEARMILFYACDADQPFADPL